MQADFFYLGGTQFQGYSAAPARLQSGSSGRPRQLLGTRDVPTTLCRWSECWMLGGAGCQGERHEARGSTEIFFLLRMSMCTVVFLRLPGVSARGGVLRVLVHRHS